MNARQARATTRRSLYRGGLVLAVTLPLVVPFETFLTIVMALALGIVAGGFVLALVICFMGLGLPGEDGIDELLEPPLPLSPLPSPTSRVYARRTSTCRVPQARGAGELS